MSRAHWIRNETYIYFFCNFQKKNKSSIIKSTFEKYDNSISLSNNNRPIHLSYWAHPLGYHIDKNREFFLFVKTEFMYKEIYNDNLNILFNQMLDYFILKIKYSIK